MLNGICRSLINITPWLSLKKEIMVPVRKKLVNRTKQGQRDLTGIGHDIYFLVRSIYDSVSNADYTTHWQYWLLSYAGVIYEWWLSRDLEGHGIGRGILMALPRHSTGGNEENHKDSSQNNRWKCKTPKRSLLKRSHEKIVRTLSRCFRLLCPISLMSHLTSYFYSS